MSTELVMIIAAVVLLLVALYNTVISKRNQVNNAFASIDAILKKRYDLLPNLIETVKAYMQHEKSTLTEITELRAKATQGALGDNEKIELNNKLGQALRSVNVAVENYPELKANTNFLQLQAAMNEVEEQLSAARRAFNAAVTSYNNAVQMFPMSIIAGIFGFKARTLFEANETERKNIDAGAMFRQ